MSSVIFQDVAYMNVNEMIKDVYFAIYSKLGKSITFESLLNIYKKNEYRYREELIYEEDIEDEKKWQKDSAEVIQLAKDAISYIFNFPEYTVAIDIKLGNDDCEEYEGDFLKKIKDILNTSTIKMLLQLVDFVDYYNVDTDITE
jgi:hypothetical protein